MNYWPSDITSDEVLSPREILEEAGAELQDRTRRLKVEIRESELDDRTILAFDVVNPRAKITLTLFEVNHRKQQSYPAAIIPPEDDEPDFLKRRYYVPGHGEYGDYGGEGYWIDNDWVCASPSEFREKLMKVLSQDSLKARILSLLAASQQVQSAANPAS